MDTAKLDQLWKYGVIKNLFLDNALTKTANFITSFQHVDFYVVEDLPGQGLLQSILQRDVV